MPRQIINQFGKHCPPYLLIDAAIRDPEVEEIRLLLETWEANDSLDELIDESEDGPEGTTHCYKENGVIAYLEVDPQQVSILHVVFEHEPAMEETE